MAWGGPVLVDWVWALAGTGIGEVWLARIESGTKEGEEQDLMHGDEQYSSSELQVSDQARGIRVPRGSLVSLSLVSLVLFLGTYGPPASFLPMHPTPTSDMEHRYPPLKVACVVPPSQYDRHGKQSPSTDSFPPSEWIRESKVVASTGSKVLLWTEAAVRIELSGNGNGNWKKGGEQGWAGMQEKERELLREVAAVADQYKVGFILLGFTRNMIINTFLMHSASSQRRIS